MSGWCPKVYNYLTAAQKDILYWVKWNGGRELWSRESAVKNVLQVWERYSVPSSLATVGCLAAFQRPERFDCNLFLPPKFSLERVLPDVFWNFHVCRPED